MATIPEVPSEIDVLTSRTKIYASEIKTLKTSLQEKDVDLQEAHSSVKKLTKELTLEKNNNNSLKVDNDALKKKIHQYVDNEVTLQEKIKKLNFQSEQLKIRAEESEKRDIDTQKNIQEKDMALKTREQNLLLKIQQLETSHAKELGKMKNIHTANMEERVNNFAKSENSLKLEINGLNQQLNLMDREYKDTIASQAQRLVAYEQQINVMERDLVKLRITNEYNAAPKTLSNNNLLNHLKEENKTLRNVNMDKEEEIQQLTRKLNLVKINTHHDFRDFKHRY